MSNFQLRANELDFFAIKDNLKAYLRSQPGLTDYDYEGSTLSVLLDVLAYNTHYNALYMNMASNEMFIDSASKYSSIVSHAKTLGYHPSSYRASTVSVTLTVKTSSSGNAPSVITLPAGTTFSGQNASGTTYTFNLQTPASAKRVSSAFTNADVEIAGSGVYLFENITLHSGDKVETVYIASDATRYIIPNEQADTDTLRVTVQNPSDSSFVEFIASSDYLRVKSTDAVYFMKMNDDGLYEIFFGEGVIGQAVTPGHIVKMSYLVVGGQASNGIRNIRYSGTTSYGSFTIDSAQVVALSPSENGVERESKESIRANAPRQYKTQGRAVTADDYRSLLLSEFKGLRYVSVWGGQDNYPPVYGKVFVCAKPLIANKVTPALKADILRFLQQKVGMITASYEIVDPEFVNVIVSANVRYNDRKTTKAPQDIIQIAKESLIQYSEDSLDDFNKEVIYSQLVNSIENSDAAIFGVDLDVTYRRVVNTVVGSTVTYKFDFGDELSELSAGSYMISEPFIMKFPTTGETAIGKIISEGGILYQYKLNTASEVYEKMAKVGTIDASGGTGQFKVETYANSIVFYFKTRNRNYRTTRDCFAKILESDLTISVSVE